MSETEMLLHGLQDLFGCNKSTTVLYNDYHGYD
jgi:hypothetical protein